MKKIRSPKKRGVAKVPVCMQMESMECGAACLAMILAYYGKWVPISHLRTLCGISRDGVRLSSVTRAARSFGLAAQGYRYEVDEFFEKASFPCIVHWDFTHFVVVCGRRGKTVYINDPGRGSMKITMQDFDDAFTGVCVCFQPGEGFEPSGKPRSIYAYLSENLKGAGSTVLFVTAASLLVALSGTLLPALSRIFLDRILSGRDPGWLIPLLVLMGVICLIQLIVGFVHGRCQHDRDDQGCRRGECLVRQMGRVSGECQ